MSYLHLRSKKKEPGLCVLDMVWFEGQVASDGGEGLTCVEVLSPHGLGQGVDVGWGPRRITPIRAPYSLTCSQKFLAPFGPSRAPHLLDWWLPSRRGTSSAWSLCREGALSFLLPPPALDLTRLDRLWSVLVGCWETE